MFVLCEGLKFLPCIIAELEKFFFFTNSSTTLKPANIIEHNPGYYSNSNWLIIIGCQGSMSAECSRSSLEIPKEVYFLSWLALMVICTANLSRTLLGTGMATVSSSFGRLSLLYL